MRVYEYVVYYVPKGADIFDATNIAHARGKVTAVDVNDAYNAALRHFEREYDETLVVLLNWFIREVRA